MEKGLNSTGDKRPQNLNKIQDARDPKLYFSQMTTSQLQKNSYQTNPLYVDSV